MATGVNYWSSNETHYKVSERAWGGEHHDSSSSEEGGGGVTWEMPAMEVKGQLISAPDPLTCTDRKQRERMAELQERRRSLQVLLSSRLAELRRICLQEAELTGAVPRDFPLEDGEKPPCVRRRGGASRQGNRKYRAEDDDCQRLKLKKTLFSSALRKHIDSEHNAHTQTHTHHGKRTVHRGCHTDDTVRSESSSTSDSTGLDNEDSVSQYRPPLVAAGSPVDVFYPNKTRRDSLHNNRADQSETLPPNKPLPLLPSHPPPLSQDSSSSSDPGVAAGEGGIRVSGARGSSSSSDGLQDRVASSKEDGFRGTNPAGVFQNSDVLTAGRANGRSSKPTEGAGAGGRGSGAGRGRGGGYNEVLLDYVWGKQQQQQMQRQHSQPGTRQPITSHFYNGYPAHNQDAPPTLRQVKVTRTKSCGPFLPVQQQKESEDQTPSPPPPPSSAIQPDPHPHLLPPRPLQLPPNQSAHLEEATRSLHKALALEGLRDWYLRNTVGSAHQNHTNGKTSAGFTSGFPAKVNDGVRGQSGRGAALQRRRTTHGVVHQSTYQTEATQRHPTLSHHKQTLPHSATFHGHPLHGRSVDSSVYHDPFPPQKQEVLVRELSLDQPSPGTLV